jgi:hypothetical protein
MLEKLRRFSDGGKLADLPAPLASWLFADQAAYLLSVAETAKE